MRTQLATVLLLGCATAIAAEPSWLVTCSKHNDSQWTYKIGEKQVEVCVKLGYDYHECFYGQVEGIWYLDSDGSVDDDSWMAERSTYFTMGDEREFRNHFVLKTNGEFMAKHLVTSGKPTFGYSDRSDECTLVNEPTVRRWIIDAREEIAKKQKQPNK